MTELEEIINQLYVLCGVFLASSALFFFFALDFKKKAISLLLWFAAFNGLYLGGGGLQTLLTASLSELEGLFWKYNINLETLHHAYLPWFIFCGTVVFMNLTLPSKVSLNCFAGLLEEKRTFFKNFLILTFFLLVFWSFKMGGLGYMGQNVGTERSTYEINPFYSLLNLGFIAFFPFLFVMLFNDNKSCFLLFIFLCSVFLALALGRRILISLFIAPMVFIAVRNPIILRHAKTYMMLGSAAIIIAFSSSFFYGLRLASYSFSTTQKEISLFSLAPDALTLAFSSDRLIALDFKEEKGLNTSQRPFGPLGYYVFVTNLFNNSWGFHGQVLLGAFKSVIPRLFYSNKDLIMESSFDVESFVARYQNLPSGGDEAPTATTTGMVDFGYFGIFLQVFLYALVLFASVRIGKITGNRFLICVIVFLFLVQLQWAETSPVVLLETLRAILIFYFFFCFARFLGSNEYSLPRAA